MERLHSLIAAAETQGGVRTRFWSLAHTLRVEEHQVRRAAHWLAENGYIAIEPAGREGSSFVLRERRRPALHVEGRFCPWCGRHVGPEWRFCMDCGGPQSAAAAPQGAVRERVRGAARA